MKCNDCGKTDYPLNPDRKHRLDVCDDCWRLRALLISEMGGIDPKEFQSVQREIATKSGRGAAAMREVLGLDQPQI